MIVRWPIGTLGVVAALVCGCLPEDTREPPGKVTVTLRGADATIDGFDTVDGWRLRFDRVLVTAGAADLEDCSVYSDGDYLRIVDGLTPAPQLLGVVYGLGTCGIELRAGNPSSSTLLGVGVGEADKTFMREGASDAHQENAGVTFWIRGSAEKDATVKTFEWLYRRPRLALEKCALPAPLQLAEDVSLGVEFRVHVAVLFEDDLGSRSFDGYAAADADGDGRITLAELDQAPGPKAQTLGQFVYDVAFPNILRVGESGKCTPSTRMRGGP